MAIAALAAGDNNDTVVFVEYERLIESPHAHAEQLASALDKACETTTSAETVAAMAAVPDAGLRHQSPTPSDGLDNVQRALYDLQRAKVDDRAVQFDPSAFPLPPGWRKRIVDEERPAMANQDGPPVGNG